MHSCIFYKGSSQIIQLLTSIVHSCKKRNCKFSGARLGVTTYREICLTFVGRRINPINYDSPNKFIDENIAPTLILDMHEMFHMIA